jgi:hypothetical protein
VLIVARVLQGVAAGLLIPVTSRPALQPGTIPDAG